MKRSTFDNPDHSKVHTTEITEREYFDIIECGVLAMVRYRKIKSTTQNEKIETDVMEDSRIVIPVVCIEDVKEKKENASNVRAFFVRNEDLYGYILGLETMNVITPQNEKEFYGLVKSKSHSVVFSVSGSCFYYEDVECKIPVRQVSYYDIEVHRMNPDKYMRMYKLLTSREDVQVVSHQVTHIDDDKKVENHRIVIALFELDEYRIARNKLKSPDSSLRRKLRLGSGKNISMFGGNVRLTGYDRYVTTKISQYTTNMTRFKTGYNKRLTNLMEMFK